MMYDTGLYIVAFVLRVLPLVLYALLYALLLINILKKIAYQVSIPGYT